MIDLIKLEKREEITTFVNSLWLSPIFKNNLYVKNWVEKFSVGPKVFASMSNPQLEYAHFGTWFGLTYLRQYDNAIVSDLYYLHEIVHAVLSKYSLSDTFTSWFRRMNEIEFAASLETEANIYIEIPELRKHSFDDRIWADRFLGTNLPAAETIKIMRQERYRAMREPDPMDYCEQQIAGYVKQNFEWANIWKLPHNGHPAWQIVDRHMYLFTNGEINTDEHIKWLNTTSTYRSGSSIPFLEQAELFAAAYWRNKLGYKKS